VPQPAISANGVKGLFEAVRDQELRVTHHVGLVFVDEQHEENAQRRFVLDRIDLIGDGPQSLYSIDRELTALAERKGAAA
jgi:ferritin